MYPHTHTHVYMYVHIYVYLYTSKQMNNGRKNNLNFSSWSCAWNGATLSLRRNLPSKLVFTARWWRLEPRLDLESALNCFARATFWSTLLKDTQCPGESSTSKTNQNSKSGHLWSWSRGCDSDCMLRECFDDFPPSPNGRHDASLPRGPTWSQLGTGSALCLCI